MYTVIVMANKEMNEGQKDYSQMYKAIDLDDRCVAEHYDGNNKIGDSFSYYVTEKQFIKSNTGEGAIFKFQKWRREGLDDNYLFNKE